jgi:hypothetical protein
VGGASAWQLRGGDQRFGRISTMTHEVSGAAGSWRVEAARRRFPIVFQPRSPTDLVAAYYPQRLMQGGSISFSTGEAYVLRVNLLSGVSRLTDQDGNEVCRITPRRGKTESTKLPTLNVELHQISSNEAMTLMATRAVCYVLLATTPVVIGTAA